MRYGDEGLRNREKDKLKIRPNLRKKRKARSRIWIEFINIF